MNTSPQLAHIWSVLCSSSSIDQETNNVSLQNVLEQLSTEKRAFEAAGDSKKKTIISINYELVSLWKRIAKGNISATIKIECLDPAGKILFTNEIPLQIGAEKERARTRIRYNNLPITTVGEYGFRISVKDGSTSHFFQSAMIPLTVTTDER